LEQDRFNKVRRPSQPAQGFTVLLSANSVQTKAMLAFESDKMTSASNLPRCCYLAELKEDRKLLLAHFRCGFIITAPANGLISAKKVAE